MNIKNLGLLILFISNFNLIRPAMESHDFHSAAEHGDAENVTRFLKNGANVNVQDIHDNTPLHYAAHGGHIKIVKTLLYYGANIHLKNNREQTACDLAASKKHHDITKLLQLAECNKFDNFYSSPGCLENVLNRLNDPVYIKNLTEKTVNAAGTIARDAIFNTAVLYNHSKITEALIKLGANVNTQDTDKQTALHCAAKSGHIEIVKILLKHNANVNVQDTDKQTALHCAARFGHIEIVKILLEHDANIFLKDTNNNTAYNHAISAKHTKIAKLLQNNAKEKYGCLLI